MTRDRALEILELGARYSNYSDKMTEQEIAEVKTLWYTMPGWTCFYDALCRFAYPRSPKNSLQTAKNHANDVTTPNRKEDLSTLD